MITDAAQGLCQPPLHPECVREDVPMNLALAQNLPPAEVNPEYSMFADEGDVFTMSLNLQHLIDPDTFEGDTTVVCDTIPDAECDLLDGACVCEYDDDVDCETLFGHSERVLPLIAQEGMMVLSHEGCSCDGRTCILTLMSSVPPIRTSEESTTAAVKLTSNNNAETCDLTVVCPNMDRCEPVAYGGSGCGYGCDSDEGHFWCSSECACNKEEAVSTCPAGVTCPNMQFCDPISYGDYGCGYGCMRDSVYHFCNDACTVCNV